MVRCTRCGKEGHNARNKLCPALKDSQRPRSGAGAGSNDRFAPQTDLNAENRSSLRAPAGNQRYALAGGSGYKKDAFRNNDLGDSSVHDELSYHFNIAYIKDVDVPRHWLKMLHQFFMRMNASMIHGVMERARDGSGGVKFFLSKKPVRGEGGIILHKLHIHFVVSFPMPNNAIAVRIFKEMVLHLLFIKPGEVKMSMKALEDGTSTEKGLHGYLEKNKDGPGFERILHRVSKKELQEGILAYRVRMGSARLCWDVLGSRCCRADTCVTGSQ